MAEEDVGETCLALNIELLIISSFFSACFSSNAAMKSNGLELKACSYYGIYNSWFQESYDSKMVT